MHSVKRERDATRDMQPIYAPDYVPICAPLLLN